MDRTTPCKVGEVIYVAGKFSSSDPERVQEHMDLAVSVGKMVFQKGHTPIIPHILFPYCTVEEWTEVMKSCIQLVHRCDSILMLRNWRDSFGAQIERYVAQAIGRTVYYSLRDIPTIQSGFMVDQAVIDELEKIE